MFELRAIEKRFGAVQALSGASLSVKPGEVRALLGSNGSGKSTMVKVLAGLVNPNSGDILFDGKPVTIRNGFDSRKLGIATAFQDLSLVPMMTVRDNLLLGVEPVSKIGVVNKKQATRSILELLDQFGVRCNLNAYVQTLTPSTQTMLEVAKAVALKPRLLLLDEVTAALHYDEVQILFRAIRELKEQGIAMIYVTHRINEVFQICDTATFMRGGETVAEADVKDLTVDEIVFHMTGQWPEKEKKREAHSVDDSSEAPLLQVEHLEMLPKVQDLSLKAYKGEIIGLAGLQGQGQPEVIRAILGAEPHQGGAITYKGLPVRFKSPAEAVAKGIGFISGERNREAMFPLRSILENLLAGKVAKGKMFAFMPPPSNRAFAQNAVKKYSIKIGSLRDPASSLSGGNQQKLVVARWIAMNPSLLLLDDPTKGVDIHSRREIHRILQDCAAQGMTVILSSSESEELLDITDRIYVFYEGKISDILHGARKTPEALVAAMMGVTEGAPETEDATA